jgi:N-acyl-D-amino-acid deacylase
MRSEANGLQEALDETIGIARATKQAHRGLPPQGRGRKNWPKMAQAIASIEAARAQGLDVAANMYAYTAVPPDWMRAFRLWVQAGGREALNQRLRDPKTRARVIADMKDPNAGWENLRLQAGSPDACCSSASSRKNSSR